MIFISIDDNEVAQLRKICDEVFGEENFIAQMIWQRAFSPKNDAKHISNSHDYVQMYVKSIVDFKIGRLPRTEEANARYSNPDNDARGVWMSSDISVKTYNSENDYPITAPSGRVIEPPTGRCWRLSKNAFLERLQDNRIWFGPDGNGTPRIKRFLSELAFSGMTPTSIMLHKDVGHSQEGAQEVTKLLEAGIFDGPKPVRLLKRLLTLSNANNSDIILDFFSGSATTAHAVMQINAEDGGNRKFILVQLPEVCADGTEAAKAGYKTICEIGKERIRRAGEKIVGSGKWVVDSEEEKKKYGCKELSRADCMAEGNGSGPADLCSGQKTAERGTLLPVRSDEEGIGIDPLEHRGGSSEELNEGVCSVSGNSKRVESGAGNTAAALRESGIPCRYGHFGSDASTPRSGENVGCPHKNTNHCPLTTTHSPLDIGFRVLKVDETNVNDVYYAPSEYTQQKLLGLVDNIKPDRTDMDLLFACLLDWGLPLSMTHTHEKIDGFTVHTYNNGDLIACFDKDVSEKLIREIAGRSPLRAVFRDNGFSNSPEKINVFEIFKLLAPRTSVKVI